MLTGELWVQLDQAIVDIDTTPDSTILPRLFKFAIAAGSVNISLRESETHQVTYRFQFWAQASAGPPAVLDSEPSIDFHAYVPNLASCDFADLLPTSIVADLRDTAIARLARLLTANQQFAAALRGGPRYLGAYNAATYYQLDDCVSYGGSSWIWVNPTPAAASTPAIANTNWMLAASKGDAGGTGGQDTAYDPTGWDGATWAPTANAVRDRLEQLATITALNTKVGAADVELQITNRFANAALTGDPTTPNQDVNVAIATNGSRIVNMTTLKNNYRYSRITDTKPQNTNGGSCVAGINTRDLNTIAVNSGDIVALSGNTFTLRAGTYIINAIGQLFAASNNAANRLFLWSVSGSTRLLSGAGEHLLGNTQAMARVSGRFTLATQTDLQIRHYSSLAVATNGFGIALNEAGQTETYVIVELWRID